MKKILDEVIIMQNRLLALTTAVALLFGISCVNLTVVAVTENDEETTEHEHTYVETTETVHYDDQYVTKTIWINGYNFYRNELLPHGTLAELAPDRVDPNRYYLEDTNNIYYKAFIAGTEFYDAFYWMYGSYENWPCDKITIDNYWEYGLTYEEFSTRDEYSVFNTKLPEFNPKYDVLLHNSYFMA